MPADVTYSWRNHKQFGGFRGKVAERFANLAGLSYNFELISWIDR